MEARTTSGPQTAARHGALGAEKWWVYALASAIFLATAIAFWLASGGRWDQGPPRELTPRGELTPPTDIGPTGEVPP